MFHLTRGDQSSKVPAYMLDIMSSMVEEGVTLTDDTLDELFGALLPKPKVDIACMLRNSVAHAVHM